jgi:CRP/FNR family transcriptional regulator
MPSALNDLLRLLGSPIDDAIAEFNVPVPLRRVATGSTLFHEGTPAKWLYVVRSGSFKTIKTAEDGYEQVLGFALRGDLLGYEALGDGEAPMGAVALEDSTVFALSVGDLEGWRRSFPPLDHALQRTLARQLMHSGEIAQMMAAVAAEVRLARFLVWLSARMEEMGQSPRRMRLRMCRRDIASFLGVAHETVSRSFTALADSGLLRVDNREVEIVDANALRTCSRSTRGLGGVPHRSLARQAVRMHAQLAAA